MSHLTPNTPTATAKLLRTLTSTLPTSRSAPTPSETFTTATTETSEPLLTTLLSVLIPSSPPQTLNHALHTLFNLSNTLPPSHLAPHWRTLCQRVLTISKQFPQPRTLITLSALLIASIPLSKLGTEQRAIIAGIAQQSLQHAQISLSTYPTQSLCLIHAIIQAAPREFRSQALDQRLQHFFKHPRRDVRTLVAKVFAALVTCVTEKQQQNVFSERVEYINDHIIEVTNLLDAFTGGKYEGSMSQYTVREFCDHLGAVCMLLTQLLDLPIRAAFPLAKVLKMLCDGVRERVIDPYAVVEGVNITHDDLLTVVPQVQRLCASAIADVTQRIHKNSLQLFVKEVGEVFEMRLSKLLLRSRDSGLTCVVERGELYETIGRLITSLGTGFLDFVVPRFRELFDVDVELYKKSLAGEKLLAVDPVSNVQSAGKSRKRRRHNGRRDAAVGGHNLTKEGVQRLESVYGNETACSVESTFNMALDVIARMFDCRGLLTRVVGMHLQKLEEILLEFLEDNRLSAALLRAATSAALSGGSNRMAAEASLLLIPLTRVSLMTALNTNLSSKTRDAALVARTACEAIIHPRGPPYVKESCMLPPIVDNDRSSMEKRVPKKSSTRPSAKLTSEENGGLADQDDGDAICADAKKTVNEQQEGLSFEEAGEKSGKAIMDGKPASDPMEVDVVAEIEPLTNEKEEFPKKVVTTGNEKIEIVQTKQQDPRQTPVDANNPGTDECDHRVPMEEKTRGEELQNSATADYKAEELKGMTVENTKESPKRPSHNQVSTERAAVAERKESTNQPQEYNPLSDRDPVKLSDSDDGDEQNSEREDQALIDSLVFEPSDEE